MNKIITFIGAGNMARSLIAGLIQDGTQHSIRISDPDESQLQTIQQNWSNVAAFSDNVEAISGADVVVLAVKPQIMQLVCEPLQESIQPESSGHLDRCRNQYCESNTLAW